MTSSQSLARLTASSISLLTGFAFCSRPKKKSARGRFSQDYELAEEEGFEPSLPGLRVKRFSRPPHSTTLPPLRIRDEAATVFSSSVSTTRPSASPQVIQFSWRRDGDSNPGYAFGVYTISNRAPSASSDISPLRHRVPHHLTKQQLSSIQQP